MSFGYRSSMISQRLTWEQWLCSRAVRVSYLLGQARATVRQTPTTAWASSEAQMPAQTGVKSLPALTVTPSKVSALVRLRSAAQILRWWLLAPERSRKAAWMDSIRAQIAAYTSPATAAKRGSGHPSKMALQ